jgi:hypothetical protein
MRAALRTASQLPHALSSLVGRGRAPLEVPNAVDSNRKIRLQNPVGDLMTRQG